LFGDWTDRIAAGELPFAKPERPQGIERNVVLTLWDWSRPTAYGTLYGAPENSTDYVPILDPITHTVTEVLHPVRDPKTPSHRTDPMAPSPYWGPEPIWDSQTSNHNPMMDEKGRVWFTARVRPPANPDFCKKGSDHPSAKVFPLESADQHVDAVDPRHQRQRQAGRVSGAQPADRSHERQAGRGGPLLGRREPGRWVGPGNGAGIPIPWLRHSGQSGTESDGDRAGGGLRTAASRIRTAWR